MSGRKPVLVSVMYSPKGHTRIGSVHRSAWGPREQTSFSRSSRTLGRAGQVWLASLKVSGSAPDRGQVGSRFTSNHAGCVARGLFAASI